ncbi:hypothetical protein BC835DRAFT_1269501 [Cytidiella melzeri]|nr:hypothetical protein BC835DRAFT_1269501 [Cytidiella melzeri]
MSDNLSGPSAVKSKADLPPSRDRKALRPVSPPLSNVSMHRFNYYVALAATLLLAVYAWRVTVWKAEAGGWWNLMLGKQPPAFRDGNNGSGISKAATGTSSYASPATSGGHAGADLTVEDRINDLASALGMPSKDLASAIAVAVHEYVPPASISSIAASQTGSAVEFLVDPSGAAEAEASATAVAPAAAKGLRAAAKAFEAAVGMEEPPSEMA